jgi:hypothetical protein
MQGRVQLEDIAELRRREGIDDVELWQGIRNLRVGDLVKLTFLNDSKPLAGETLVVRITSIRGSAFRGKLADTPVSAGLASLTARSSVVFRDAHIHSLQKVQRPNES